MLWVAAVLTLVTGWDYLMAGLRHASAAKVPEPQVPGPLPRQPG
jgi:cardiolipin synthase